MATRKYEQKLRAEQSDETRRRILDAVAQCLRESPTEPVSLDKVATIARVARSTIYLVFGSRAGLFDAFAEDLFMRSGLPKLTEAVANPDAREHLRGAIAAATRMLAAEDDIFRVLTAMSRLDPDSVGGTVAKREENRLGGMEYLARRLSEDGALRDDVTVDEAVSMLWVLASFETFDLLHTGRGLSVDDTIDVLIKMSERSLCREEKPKRRPRKAAPRSAARAR
jgi:AcrR family transcriptional regulator